MTMLDSCGMLPAGRKSAALSYVPFAPMHHMCYSTWQI